MRCGNEKQGNGRIYYLDALRALGCLAVVLLHVSSKFTLETVGSLNYWLGITFDGISQFAVPLFVMVSGALHLKETYDFSKRKLNSQIGKLVVFFFGWSAIYCLVFTVLKNYVFGNQISFYDILSALFSGPYHLWFIPMMVGLYLIVPLLRLWVKKENRKLVEYFLILTFLFNTLIPGAVSLLSYGFPQYSDVFAFADGLWFRYGTGYVMYFVLGWYLRTFEIVRKKLVYSAGIAGVFISVVGTYILTVWKNDTSFFFGNFSLGILSYSISIFTFVKSKFDNAGGVNRFVKLICDNSMGIYAMHTAVFPLFTYILRIGNAACAIPVEFLIAFLLPLLCTSLFKRIPILKKIV